MFAQPWAWLGLAALAVPIAIHLLARQQAVRARFPTLRFIQINELSAISRHRLTDIPLLLVRLAILAAIVAAIAGPRWSAQASGAGPSALAVVVDTSASAAGDEGRKAAQTAVANVPTSTVIESASLPEAVKSATAWLQRQTGRRELRVISDFQVGSIDEAVVKSVPADIGLSFTPLAMFAPKLPEGFALNGDRSRMAWGPTAGRETLPLPLAVKAGADQSRAEAMLSAVASLVTTNPVDATARHATLVFKTAPEFATLTASTSPITQPWMYAATQSLMADQELRGHVVLAAQGAELMVLVDDAPDSVIAGTIALRMLHELLQPLDWNELEPRSIAPETLRGWERAPATTSSRNNGEPQGRWLWLVALMLLGVEMWMRRGRAATAAPQKEGAHARVA